ncbi:MAG: (Glutamate--ammonia-ligase) adenylyltransferase [Ignavibacteria bacterium]|nr:MAG: (Glutamate--ammonia-ligase) adenylyltransferase [Ignavibacteria bacterium]KAF0160482.1 MAG: (Glutamate--ammonia-ligase) adenylyltransferase [Ignavibacteria bacterium]
MTERKFHFTDSFIAKLVVLSEGLLSSQTFENVVAQLEENASKFYFTHSSEANLIRIFSAVYDKSFFFSDLLKLPHHAEIVVALAANSNYLTDIVVRNPEYLYQIFDQEYFSKDIKIEDLEKEVSENVKKFKSINARLTFLRQFKKRIILKIGANDILQFDELLSTTKQLSYLAKIINANLFEICYEEVLAKYKVTRPSNKFSLCSLGKLGGCELNYSSDVDLIMFYDSNSQIESTQKDFHELLSETVQLFSKSSSDITSNGYIYRVDFRLRPDGKFSPLCKSINDYIKYYEARGEDWERQMLIKLNFICGDKDLYNRFLSFVIPYVYNSFYTSSIKDKIRTMKLNIERQHNTQEDVKIFTGGIRDIEFAVQALQLLNGSKYPELRTGNSLIALNFLQSRNLLKKKEKELLAEAYIFYRRIEHFLQLMNDTQTHRIPDNPEMINKLVVYLRLDSAEIFRIKLDSYRKSVRGIYNNILKANDTLSDLEKQKAVFKEASKAEKNLQYLRSGQGIIERKEFDTRTIQLFNSIEQNLNSYLTKCYDPDKVVDNFTRVIRTTKFPSIWYSEFTNKKFFFRFLSLCEYSQKSLDLLSASNRLEDFFLSRKVFSKNLNEDFAFLTTEQIVFALSVQFTCGLVKRSKAAETLSAYFTFHLVELLRRQNLNYNYFAASLGSLGASNMNFNSDIDLIVVVEEINTEENVQQHFQEFLAKAKDKLKPFDVDFRLRPEGNKSPIVWDIKNYETYLAARARLWEFQALTKLRLIYGNNKLFKDFTSIIVKHSWCFAQKEIKAEIVKMHNYVLRQHSHALSSGINIKKDRGGLTTIDFILQLLILSDPKLLAKLIGAGYKKIFSAVNIILPEADELKNNFEKLKLAEFCVQTIFNTGNAVITSENEKRLYLSQLFSEDDVSNIEFSLKQILKFNYQLFDKLTGD